MSKLQTIEVRYMIDERTPDDLYVDFDEEQDFYSWFCSGGMSELLPIVKEAHPDMVINEVFITTEGETANPHVHTSLRLSPKTNHLGVQYAII